MKRALVALSLAVVAAGCWDFQGLLDDCRNDAGVCARDGGGGGGGGAMGGGGGATGGGGGEPIGGGGGSLANDAGGPLCALVDATGAGRGETLALSDGGTSFCFNGFQWLNPLPQGNDLWTVHGSSADDVWAAGSGAMLMHWDGGRWETFQGVVPVIEVHGSAIAGLRFLPDGGAWLVGRDVKPHQFVDGTWVPAASSLATEWFAETLGVSPNGDHVVAIDSSGYAYSPPDWESSGSGWPSSAVRAVAVADDGRCVFSASSAGQRFLSPCDGGGRINLGTNGSAGPIWVLRDGGIGYGDLDHLRQLEPDGGGTDLFAPPGNAPIWLAASTVRAGYGGYVVGTGTNAALLAGGSPVTVTGATGQSLYGVAAFEDGRGWGVGEGGALATGTTSGWQRRTGGYPQHLFGLLVDDAQVVAVGQNAIIFRPFGATGFYNPAVELRDVLLTDDGGLLVASENGSLYTGGIAVSELGAQLNGLATAAPGQHWAVGQKNLIANDLENGTWSAVTSLSAAGPNWWKVDGRDGFVVAVGEEGAVVRYLDGGVLPALDAGTSSWFYGVWVDDGNAQTAWLVGSGSGAWRLEGNALVEHSPQGLAFGTFFDVWGFDSNDVWAVGEDGLAVHWNGVSWLRFETGTRNQLERVRGRKLPGGLRELFIAGQNGTLLRYVYQPSP